MVLGQNPSLIMYGPMCKSRAFLLTTLPLRRKNAHQAADDLIETVEDVVY